MVLVTGGTGVIGSHLLLELLQHHDRIRATYRSEKKIKAFRKVVAYYGETPEKILDRIEFVKADITDIPALDRCFEGVTQVYHNAALVSFDPRSYRTLRSVNIDGTANVVNLCLHHGIKKLCYTSSIVTLGAPNPDGWTDETQEWNNDEDHNVYAITKYGAEMEVWRGIQEGLDAVIVNPGIVIGSGDWRSSSSGIIYRIYKGQDYYTEGISGYVDVLDVSRAMVTLMQSDIKNERFILVGENMSFKALAKKVAHVLNVNPPHKKATRKLLNWFWRIDWLRSRLTGKRRRLTKQMAKSLITAKQFDNRKIQEVLDFRFSSVDAAIERTCRHFLEEQQA